MKKAKGALFLIALATISCQSYPEGGNSYSEAVEGLTKNRAQALKNVGFIIIEVAPSVGFVNASSRAPLDLPEAERARVLRAPIILETNESVSSNRSRVVSSVTGYWSEKRQ